MDDFSVTAPNLAMTPHNYQFPAPGLFMSNRVIATYYIFVLLLFFSQLANAAVGEPPRLFSPFFGYVEDMNGRAIAGAKIDIAWCESQNDPDRDFSVPPGDNILGSAKSDADGAFHVEWSDDIPIQFEKQEFRLYLCVFHDEFVPFQKPLSLDDSGPIVMLIDLKEGMRYADRVVDKTGAPVQGAVVRFEGIYRSAKDTIFASYTEGSQLFLDMSNTPTTQTDENGVFEFSSVPADALILLRVQHPQYSTAMRLRSTFKTLPLVPDLSNKASGFELWWKDFDDVIELERGERFDVVVRDRASKQPLANVEVCSSFEGRSNKSNQNGLVSVLQRADIKNLVVYSRFSKEHRWNLVGFEKQEAGFGMWIESPNVIQISGAVRDTKTGVGIPNVPIASRNKVLGATDENGRFTVSHAYARSIVLSCRGPVEGWTVPFYRKSTNPEEIELKPKDGNDEIRFDPQKPEKEFVFQFDPVPNSVFQVIGLDGKPAVNAKVTVSPTQIKNVHTKDLMTDANGMVTFPLLQNICYSMLAQGQDKGAAVDSFRLLHADRKTIIQLLPSISIEMRVDNLDRELKDTPAEGASVMININKDQKELLGLEDQFPFAIRLGQVDSKGLVRCRFPRANLSLPFWNVYAGGKWFSQMTALDFRDDSYHEITLRRVEFNK